MVDVKIKSVELNLTPEKILDYAKHIRNTIGSQAFLPFLRGEEVKFVNVTTGVTVTYQLSGPAKEVLREEEKKSSGKKEASGKVSEKETKA